MKIGTELVVKVWSVTYAWIPAFGFYYLVVMAIFYFLSRNPTLSSPMAGKIRAANLFYGVVLPVLIPLPFFLNNIGKISLTTFALIQLVAIINPYFEELFWRRILGSFDVSNLMKILYSAGLFSIMHYAVWSSYWLTDVKVWATTLVATFAMGLCWMTFYIRTGNYRLIFLSHALVDVFNLSAAVYMGVPLQTI